MKWVMGVMLVTGIAIAEPYEYSCARSQSECIHSCGNQKAMCIPDEARCGQFPYGPWVVICLDPEEVGLD